MRGAEFRLRAKKGAYRCETMLFNCKLELFPVERSRLRDRETVTFGWNETAFQFNPFHKLSTASVPAGPFATPRRDSSAPRRFRTSRTKGMRELACTRLSRAHCFAKLPFADRLTCHTPLAFAHPSH